MSKRSKSRKRDNQRILYGAAGIGLLLIVVVALLLSRSGGATSASAEAISPAAYQSQFIAGSAAHVLLDVRTAEEFASGHINGAVNIPVEVLGSRLGEVPSDQPLVVYCRSGRRSAEAVQILTQAGYTGIYDLGALNDWTAQGFPVE